MSEIKQLDVSIMGREFRLACPAEEEPALLQAVQMLDEKMHEIRAGGKVVGLEKIAIMAALNIAHELLHVRVGSGDFDIGTIQRKIHSMNETIDAALQEQRALF
ncbi:cell division protein ZapA [Formivibrio citricus]|uniref:Cell division protein ZapA n=1 Tax=Formivibrio citricus TaxID=83765 RepID=A0A1I4ZG59_9NEIS|nr:cell division protein ZapA [Formivibrio citricus]SFN49242.1 cell division protein ZapA [Formivibrio citricus]